MEDGEINFQPNYREYYWLGPDLAQNKQGHYILILPAVLITPVTIQYLGINHVTVPDLVSHCTPIVRRLLQSGYVPHVHFHIATVDQIRSGHHTVLRDKPRDRT